MKNKNAEEIQIDKKITKLLNKYDLTEVDSFKLIKKLKKITKNIESDEKISAMIPVREFNNGDYLTFVTRDGLVKRTDIMDYARIRQNGLRAIDLVEGDALISVNKTDGEQEIMVAT